MAQLPLLQRREGLSVPGAVSYPSGSPVGAALQGFGNAVQNVSDRLRQLQDREESFDADIQEREFLSRLALKDEEAKQTAPANGAGLSDTVYGAIDPATGAAKPGAFDDVFNETLERMPESQRAKFAAKREVYRLQGRDRLLTAEYSRRQDYEQNEIAKTQDSVINSILQSPTDEGLDAFIDGGVQLIEKSGLDALSKEKYTYKFKQNAAKARAIAMLERDPASAANMRSLLGLPNPQAQPTTVKGGAAFNSVAPRLVSDLARDFGLTTEQAAGIVGQLGHESAGFGTLQEVKPLVPGSRGGFGFAQWTGPRRKQFEAYARMNNMDPTSYEANYGFLAYELKNTPEGAVLDQVRLARDAKAAGRIFTDKFLRPGIPGYKSRDKWTERALAAAGGGIGGEPDPRFVDMAPEDRMAIANKADALVIERQKQAAIETRGWVETVIENAPVAVQSTGIYDGDLPTFQQFAEAYGPQEAPERYSKFQTGMEVASQVHAFRAMSTAEIQTTVAAAAPTSSGNNAAMQADRYKVLSAAAAASIKAREDDPATYVQQVFPNVKQAWEAASADPSQTQAAMAVTAAAQRQLGIANMQLLPDQFVDRAVTSFKTETIPMQDRINAITGLVLGTPDRDQRRAVFNQMVAAGLPEIAEGALQAVARGDQGAARRLFEAAMTDPSKLPGKSPETKASIEESIQSTLFGDGQLADVYYGITDGSAENLLKAQRDGSLLTNAVDLRVRRGESLSNAVAAASRDLFGDLEVVMESGRVPAQILIPRGTDATPIIDGLARRIPDVRSALSQRMALPPELAGEGKAITGAVVENYIDRVMAEGYFRNVGDGYGFIDPFVGAPVSGPDGRPLIFGDQEILAAPVMPATRPARPFSENTAPLTDQNFDVFQQRMLNNQPTQLDPIEVRPTDDPTALDRVNQSRKELFDRAPEALKP